MLHSFLKRYQTMQRTLTTLTLSAFLTIGLCGPAGVAQDQSPAATTRTPPSAAAAPAKRTHPKREIKRLVTQLSLTPDQQTKLEPIVQSRDQRINDVNANTTLPEEQKEIKIRAIRQECDGQIEGVLTNTQKQQYKEMKQNRESKRKGAESQPMASPPPSARSPQ
jgi:Spy/CpxP family protein refolding chaperone